MIINNIKSGIANPNELTEAIEKYIKENSFFNKYLRRYFDNPITSFTITVLSFVPVTVLNIVSKLRISAFSKILQDVCKFTLTGVSLNFCDNLNRSCPDIDLSTISELQKQCFEAESLRSNAVISSALPMTLGTTMLVLGIMQLYFKYYPEDTSFGTHAPITSENNTYSNFTNIDLDRKDSEKTITLKDLPQEESVKEEKAEETIAPKSTPNIPRRASFFTRPRPIARTSNAESFAKPKSVIQEITIIPSSRPSLEMEMNNQ